MVAGYLCDKVIKMWNLKLSLRVLWPRRQPCDLLSS